ncbi:MAG: TetR/AcrR family transcriptional regulator [Gemmatimonadaceae bacterium]
MRTARSRSAPAQPYHHGDLHQALVEAAIALLREGGVSALTLRAAARRAGVSQAAPYRHFADHADLLAAVAADGFARLRDVMIQSVRGATSPREGLRELARAYVRFGLKHPAEYRVMFGADTAGHHRFPDLYSKSTSVYQLLVDGIVGLQQLGLVKAGDPMAIALTAWSTMHGLVTLAIDGLSPFAGERKTVLADQLENQVTVATEILMFGMAGSADSAGKKATAAKPVARSTRSSYK